MSNQNYEKGFYKKEVFRLVGLIPKGRVVYFGLIAREIGITAQLVGWILSGMKSEEWEQIPWQRVVAKNGYISSLKLGEKGILQKNLLLEDGCEIENNTVNMSKHCNENLFIEEINRTIS
jgi:alkylated DNA nucleotide flippase Atl1